VSGCEDDVRHVKGELESHRTLFGGVNRWKVGLPNGAKCVGKGLAPLDALYIRATGPPVSSRRGKCGSEGSPVRIYLKVTVVKLGKW